MTVSAESPLPLPVGVAQLRAPDFFIVGHPKCGTSALFEMLRRHPQIYMPDTKETWFFASELARTRSRQRAQVKVAQTLEQYLSLFASARPDQRVGEATPSYLRSHTAAERIRDVQPAARIVALLREPASFLRSLHLQFVQSNVESETDLRKALALETDRREGRNLPRHSAQARDLQYSSIVSYVEQLERYHAAFSREQVLVLVYEDFRADNQAAMRAVLRHLGLEEDFPIQSLSANPSVRVRSARAHRLVQSVSVGEGPASRAAKRTLKALSSRRLRHEALRLTRRRVLFTEPRPADQDLMLELRRRFKAEVLAVSEYLGRDLVSLWGYDSID